MTLSEVIFVGALRVKVNMLIIVFLSYISSVMFILYEARALHDHLRLTNNVFETEKESQYIYPKKEIKKKQQKDGKAKKK